MLLSVDTTNKPQSNISDNEAYVNSKLRANYKSSVPIRLTRFHRISISPNSTNKLSATVNKSILQVGRTPTPSKRRC